MVANESPRRLWAGVRASIFALAVGTVGGAVFAYLRMPLAWMLGSMLATTAAALFGVRVGIHRQFRALFVTVLGVLLGGAFTPVLFARAGEWTYGFAILAIYLPAACALSYVYFRHIGHMDRPTAYFAAVPGGLNEMTIIGEAMGGDIIRIALVHASRILLVVLVVPFYYRYFSVAYVPPMAVGSSMQALPPTDIVILVACGSIGWAVASLVKLPAAQLVGPLLLSAAAHLAGLTASKPPPELVALAQIVVGAAVGCRFAGLDWGRISRTLLLGLGSTALMLVLTFGLSYGLQGFIAVQPAALTLSLAPGGLTEMSLVALALGIDVAFVSSMHIARIAMVILLAPLVFRFGRGDNRQSER